MLPNSIMIFSSRPFIFILIFALFYIGCNENQKEPGSQQKNKADSTDFKIMDSISLDGIVGNYNIEVDTSYFYGLPDSQTKRTEYLTSNDLVMIYKNKNGFAYSVYQPDSGKYIYGWLLLKTLKPIYFTPPKNIKEE